LPDSAPDGPAPAAAPTQAVEWLSSTAMTFLSMGLEEDIYRYIADRLRELVPDSIVTVSSYDPPSNTILTEAVVGLGKLTDEAYRVVSLHYDVKARHKLTDIAYQGLALGQFCRVLCSFDANPPA
jgi:hypothetical protein